MDNRNGIQVVGVSFTGLLTIAFIVLKLCNVIKWSWIWVLCPIWFPVAFLLIISVILSIVIVIRGNK